MKPTTEMRFRSKIRRAENGCDEWIASRDHRGYGKFWDGKKLVVASRYSYSLDVGPIEDGMCVLHRCDNPACVRPDHLFLGSLKDNSRDMIAKGRDYFPRGENAGKAKLTIEQVDEIRAKYAAGGQTIRSLAARYGVVNSLIHGIVSRKYWKASRALLISRRAA